MKTKNETRKNFFITSLLKDSVCYRANQLIYKAEVAAAFRMNDQVAEAANQLCELGEADFLQAGQYYNALGMCRSPEGRVMGRALLEVVADSSSDFFRNKALLTLGGLAQEDGNHEQALAYYHSASLITNEWLFSQIGRNMAIIHAADGKHEKALELLQDLYPHFQRLDYLSQFIYQHSIGEELKATGNSDAASTVINAALKSPFARVYPAIHKTSREIRDAQSRGKVVSLKGARLSVNEMRGICLAEIAEGSAATVRKIYKALKPA